MTSQRLAAVLVSLYITSLTRRVSCCTGLVLTSSISERNACPSEEVTFTCTAQGDALFWRNEAFGEKTMHYTSASSIGEFTARIVSYDRNQNCLVSSLSFRATASRNGTTVTCTSRDRSSSQSHSLHIIDVALENLTVVPVSLSSVLLEWEVIPTDGYHCISNYNIQVSGPNGSQWEEEIPGTNNSLYFTGLQLIPFQEYTYCVTANLLHGQVLKLTVNFTELQGQTVNFTELQEPHPPTNLSAVIQCKEGYEIQIDWQAPLSAPLGSPLTGYLLECQVYNNTTTIELPALNTSYTLDSVPSDVVYIITVSALSDVGQSRNNPSVQFAIPSLTCMDTLVTHERSRMKAYYMRAMTDVESTDLDSNTCMVDVVPSPPCNCTNLLEETNTTDSRNQSCAGLSENKPHPPTNLSAVVQCKQGYEIQIDWQDTALFCSPLTGYLLHYHFYNSITIIELPALNTSYTLDSVPSGVVYTITVSALSEAGPSRNNPSVYIAILESINLTQIVAASTLGVVAISCGFLLSTMCICYCVIRRRKTPKRKDKDSKHLAAISQSQNSDTWSGTTFGLLHTFADIIPQ